MGVITTQRRATGGGNQGIWLVLVVLAVLVHLVEPIPADVFDPQPTTVPLAATNLQQATTTTPTTTLTFPALTVQVVHRNDTNGPSTEHDDDDDDDDDALDRIRHVYAQVVTEFFVHEILGVAYPSDNFSNFTGTMELELISSLSVGVSPNSLSQQQPQPQRDSSSSTSVTTTLHATWTGPSNDNENNGVPLENTTQLVHQALTRHPGMLQGLLKQLQKPDGFPVDTLTVQVDGIPLETIHTTTTTINTTKDHQIAPPLGTLIILCGMLVFLVPWMIMLWQSLSVPTSTPTCPKNQEQIDRLVVVKRGWGTLWFGWMHWSKRSRQQDQGEGVVVSTVPSRASTTGTTTTTTTNSSTASSATSNLSHWSHSTTAVSLMRRTNHYGFRHHHHPDDEEFEIVWESETTGCESHETEHDGTHSTEDTTESTTRHLEEEDQNENNNSALLWNPDGRLWHSARAQIIPTPLQTSTTTTIGGGFSDSSLVFYWNDPPHTQEGTPIPNRTTSTENLWHSVHYSMYQFHEDTTTVASSSSPPRMLLQGPAAAAGTTATSRLWQSLIHVPFLKTTANGHANSRVTNNHPSNNSRELSDSSQLWQSAYNFFPVLGRPTKQVVERYHHENDDNTTKQ